MIGTVKDVLPKEAMDFEHIQKIKDINVVSKHCMGWGGVVLTRTSTYGGRLKMDVDLGGTNLLAVVGLSCWFRRILKTGNKNGTH